MSFLWVFFIVSIIITIIFVYFGIKSYWGIYNGSVLGILSSIFVIIFSCSDLVFCIIGIIQPISLKKEAIRQEKERQQIEYQIENLNEDSDKIKLNEWILTYNDWVNDVNTSKEIYGWFSWYRDFDMTEHTIIDLV